MQACDRIYTQASDFWGPLLQATDFVESYFDAWNHRDAKGVADHLAANGTYCDIPENVQRSHDELITSLGDFFSQDRHRYELIGAILTSSDTIAFQYEIVPSNNATPFNSSNTYRGAEFITLREDEALTIVDYYNVPGIDKPLSVGRMTSREMQRRKYAKSGLDSEQLLDYQGRLQQIMQAQQVFLRSDMTLPKLAEAVNCSVNHLSQVINAGFGMNFFDYLNQYRIAYAKELLTKLDDQNSAILNIAFTVGFNSNSAFYDAFKKCVGQTPAQYRKAQLEKQH